MRLHIGEFRTEELLQPVDGDLFDLVDKFAAAVITLAGIALGIFVGQHRALSRQNIGGNDVFRSDELDLRFLAVEFLGDGVSDHRVRNGIM
ncbi:hypothetical protein D3C86_1261770 [compost metagenome]